MATGVKTGNGVMSQTATAIRDVRDGDTLKTILGVPKNAASLPAHDDRTGLTLLVLRAR